MSFKVDWQVTKKVAQILQNDNDETKVDPEKVLLRRINQFFLYNHCEKLEDDRPILRPPVDYSNPQIQVSQNRLTIFGVDFLSNKDLKQYFESPSVREIKKINQSSAWVQFQTKQDMFQALKRKSANEIATELDVKGQYQLQPYMVGKQPMKMFARCFVNIDYKLSQGDTDYIYDTAKQIFTEKQNNRARLLPPRRRLIRKQNDDLFQVPRRADSSLLSFTKNQRMTGDESLSLDMDELLSHAGTQNNPIELDLDLDISMISVPKDKPAIYEEEDDEYRFKTPNYRERFREHRHKPDEPKHFCYKTYLKKQEQEKSVQKASVVVIEE